MQNPSAEDESRRDAAAQRVADHFSWKETFFRSRPPPPPVGRLHRRQRGPKGGPTVALTLKRARAIVAAERAAAGPVAAAAEGSGGASPSSPSASSAPSPPSRQAEWALRMSEERARRNPYADLNIRSDARRTVIMANLHRSTVEEELRVFAEQFGRVVRVRIVRHHTTGRSRRYGFVEYGLPAEAQRAAQLTRMRRLRGHPIAIEMERGRTQADFLPQRMATARRIAGDGPGEGADEKAGGVAAAPELSIEDDEDAFLAAIINGE